MTQDVAREARIAGLRHEADLDAVDRRRLQLWMLTAGLLVAVSATVAVLAIWPGDRAQTLFPRGLLEGAMAALSAGFTAYIFEKERSLRRLSRLLIDERVLREGLARQVRQLNSLIRAGRALSATLELERVTDLALEHAVQLANVASGSILLMSHHGLTLKGTRGDLYLDAGDDEGIDVARTREPVFVTRHVPHNGNEPVSGMAVPLITGGQLVGVLSVFTYPGRDLGSLDLEILAAFGDHAAVAIANALRYEEERATSTQYRTLEAVRQEFAWLAR